MKTFTGSRTKPGTKPGTKEKRRCQTALTALIIALALATLSAISQETKAGQQIKADATFPKLDASILPISHKIAIGGDPDWLASGFGSVWVAVPKTNELVRVDPVHNTVQARVSVDKEPCYGIGIGTDRVWVLNCQSQTLTRVDPATNKVDLRVPVKIDSAGEGSIAVDARSVWFVSNEYGHPSTLTQVSVKTGHTIRKVAVGKDSSVVKLDSGSVWVVSSNEGQVYRVNPTSGKITAMITVAASPRFATFGAGSFWVLSQSDGSVTRIDPLTNRVKAVIAAQVPGSGGEISFGGGYVWVTMSGTPLTRIDPTRNKVVDQYGNYPKADAILHAFGSVWISDHGKGDLWRIDAAKLPRQSR